MYASVRYPTCLKYMAAMLEEKRNPEQNPITNDTSSRFKNKVDPTGSESCKMQRMQQTHWS